MLVEMMSNGEFRDKSLTSALDYESSSKPQSSPSRNLYP